MEEMQTSTEEKSIAKRGKAYTDEFRRSVVAHWLESGKPARLDVTRQVAYRWRQAWEA
jgi:transposase-like protein